MTAFFQMTVLAYMKDHYLVKNQKSKNNNNDEMMNKVLPGERRDKQKGPKWPVLFLVELGRLGQAPEIANCLYHDIYDNYMRTVY